MTGAVYKIILQPQQLAASWLSVAIVSVPDKSIFFQLESIDIFLISLQKHVVGTL